MRIIVAHSIRVANQIHIAQCISLRLPLGINRNTKIGTTIVTTTNKIVNRAINTLIMMEHLIILTKTPEITTISQIVTIMQVRVPAIKHMEKAMRNMEVKEHTTNKTHTRQETIRIVEVDNNLKRKGLLIKQAIRRCTNLVD